MSVYIFTQIFTCKYACIHLCMFCHSHKYSHSSIHTYIHIETYTYTFMCVCIHTNRSLYTCMYLHTWIHTYLHTYIHAYRLMRCVGMYLYMCHSEEWEGAFFFHLTVMVGDWTDMSKYGGTLRWLSSKYGRKWHLYQICWLSQPATADDLTSCHKAI